MLFIVLALIIGLPVLWTVSVGALRDARRARQLDPRDGCQAWVTVSGLRGRRYRCYEPVYAGGPWCRRHEVQGRTEPAEIDPDVDLIDEPQAVGRAIVQARIGIPLGIATVLGLVGALAWALQRLW